MEENTGTTAAPNRTVMILLGVIVLLLLAIVAFFLLGGNKTESPVSPAATEAPAASTGMPSTAPEAEFDPATAIKVAAGQTPEQHVSAYFDAVVAADYTTAFALLPTSKQASYGDEAAFTSQLTGYGITAYTIDSATEEGDTAEVLATATMPGGAFQYLWTFVKDGDSWLVKSRELPGMGQ